MTLGQRSIPNGVDKTSDSPSQEANHSAGSIHAHGSEADVLDIRERIKFPLTSESTTWANLDRELCEQLEEKVKGPLNDKIKSFTEVIYSCCLSKFGTIKKQPKKTPGLSRRQKEIQDIRRQKKDARRQWKAAAEHEKEGLKEMWGMLKRRHSDLCKAERQRKKKHDKQRCRQDFMRGVQPI